MNTKGLKIINYQNKLELYEKLVLTIPAVGRKGATMPYTSINGNMFSVLYIDGTLGLRLPPEVWEGFLKKYKTSLVEAYGTILKEYVSVLDELLEKTSELKKYFALSFEYVGSLKPKPTKKASAVKKRKSK